MKLNINGRSREVDVEPEMPLLWVLRDELDLKGTKFSGSIAQCGYCQSGQQMAAIALLKKKPNPTDADIDAAMTNAGRRIYGERISQGHPTGYPTYRLEWQSLGSLGRRLRACLSGIRGDMFAPGSKEHGDLEWYLAWRAQGLPSEAPGVRR